MKLDFLKRFEFFTGVPDSQLKSLINYLMKNYGISDKHIIAANEGNAVAIAAGYHLATGKVPVVYLQNSGEGNIINPVASLLSEKVYKMPCVFFIGWRGEPGTHDEPQHIYQGEITLKLLEDMGIYYYIISKETKENDIYEALAKFDKLLSDGKQVAFVVKKDALEFDEKVKYQNSYELTREDAIKHIIDFTGDDQIVSTTGKASRELFEAREEKNMGHGHDFLTVGSMGHSSSIALGIALSRPDKKIWVIDGDGAALMHMGAMPVIGANHPKNLVHILINNEAHESVGGMPTVANSVDFLKIAEASNYDKVYSACNLDELDAILEKAKDENVLTFIEVKAKIGARDDLGRPTTKAIDNKIAFMKEFN